MPARYKRVRFRRRRLRRMSRRFRRRNPGKGSRGVRFLKLRQVITLSSSSGTGPYQIMHTVNDNPSGTNDWVSCSNLFDSYRVCAIKIHFIPDLPNDTSSQHSFDPVYVCWDVDSPTQVVTTINHAAQYENLKAFGLYRPWVYFVRCPKYYGNAANPSVVMAGGFHDTVSPEAHGGIQIFATNLSSSTLYGTLIQTFYLAFKNRK